jgi:hypothetical protein
MKKVSRKKGKGIRSINNYCISFRTAEQLSGRRIKGGGKIDQLRGSPTTTTCRARSIQLERIRIVIHSLIIFNADPFCLCLPFFISLVALPDPITWSDASSRLITRRPCVDLGSRKIMKISWQNSYLNKKGKHGATSAGGFTDFTAINLLDGTTREEIIELNPAQHYISEMEKDQID